MIQLAKFIRKLLNILDAGADTHVFGASWLPLFIEGPLTKRADIIGFDDKAARKHNLPIGPHATKVKDTNNRTIILRGQHGVGNRSSNHTLLCTFELREMGIQVDDVHTRHIKSTNGEKGTQQIVFQDGTIINLVCKTALMSFQSTKTTMDEVINKVYPIYDIAQKNWNPRIHYDDVNALSDESNHVHDTQQEKTRLFYTHTKNVNLENNQILGLIDDNDTVERDDDSTMSNDNSSMPYLVKRDDNSTISSDSSSVCLLSPKHYPW